MPALLPSLPFAPPVASGGSPRGAAFAVAILLFGAFTLGFECQAATEDRIAVLETRLFLTQDQLTKIGLANHDATMPIVHRDDGSYWIYLSEGGATDGKHSHIVRLKTDLATADLASVEDVAISGIPAAQVNQYNGWKAWMMALYPMGSGEYVALLHFEDQDTGPKECFRLGTAYSRDGGRSFRFLGFIITTHISDETVKRGNYRGKANIAGAGLRWDAEHVYYYFSDMTNEDARDRRLAVARTTRAEFERSARAGQTTPWWKYHDGRWTEPGLGGRSASLGTLGDYHTTIAYNTHLRQWILCSIRGGQVIMLRSADPLNFHVPDEPVCPIPRGTQIHYCTIQALAGDGPRCGQEFYLFYRHSRLRQYDTGRMKLAFRSVP